MTCHEQRISSHVIKRACSPCLKLSPVVLAGQGNYGYGNMAASELCRARRALGLPAIAFGAGPISGVGYVADNLDLVRSAGRLLPARLVCCQHRTCLQLASRCCVSASPDWGAASVQEFSGRVMQLLAHQPVDEVISVLGTLLCKPDSHSPCYIYVTRVRKQNTGVSTHPARCPLTDKPKLPHHVHDIQLMLPTEAQFRSGHN